MADLPSTPRIKMNDIEIAGESPVTSDVMRKIGIDLNSIIDELATSTGDAMIVVGGGVINITSVVFGGATIVTTAANQVAHVFVQASIQATSGHAIRLKCGSALIGQVATNGFGEQYLGSAKAAAGIDCVGQLFTIEIPPSTTFSYDSTFNGTGGKITGTYTIYQNPV